MLHHITKAIHDWQRANWFRDLVSTGDAASLSDKDAPRTVILVRDDILPPIHQGIQAMHAVIELESLLHEQSGCRSLIDPRCYLILLGASKEQMEDYAAKLWKRHHVFSAKFSDPGLVDHETDEPPVTAVAFEPMTAQQVRVRFGGLKRAS